MMNGDAKAGLADVPRKVRAKQPGLIGRIIGLQEGCAHGRVLSAAAVVGIFALAAKLVAAGKEVVVARQFGLSDQVDAFGLALTLPGFALSLIGGSLNSALLPVYVDVRRREGDDAAKRLLSTVTFLATGLLVVVALALAALVPIFLFPVSNRFTPDKLRLTAELSYLLIPGVVVAGTTMTWTAALNAHGRFAPSAAAAMAVPLVAVLGLLVFGKSFGVRSLAVGTLMGYCVEALFVARALMRERHPVLPRWGGWTPAVRKVAGQFAPCVVGVLVMGMNPVIDSLMAAQLDAGSIASLNYGNKLVAFTMGIGSLSLATAVFPYFSQLVSLEDWSGLAKTIRVYALVMFAILTPAILALIAASEPIVRILYERGAFSRADTVQVARIQVFSLLQVPFYLTGLLFVRFVSATARNSLLMCASILNLVVNIVGNVVFARYLGAAGIALSTSVVYFVSFTFLGWCTWRQLKALRLAQEVQQVD